MSKKLFAKHYQENKENAPERYQNLSKEENKKKNVVVKVTKIFQKMKKIHWLSIEKKKMSRNASL